jgi:hypothetical protein
MIDPQAQALKLDPEIAAATMAKAPPMAPGIQAGRPIVVEGVEYMRYPIRMARLVGFGESLEGLLDEFVKPYFKEGDWLAISEKMFSISQNLVCHISTIKVTWLARLITKGVKKHKTMTAWSRPEKMQLAINIAGWWRIIPAAAFGAFGKLIGQRGLFWVIAGHRVSEIDGMIPEDMYPYTEWAVLPPPHPQKDCQGIEDHTGMPAVTADANFINVKILGVSKGVGLSKRLTRLVLLDNPLGQGNKMTPFVLVRKVGPAPAGTPDTVVNRTKI